MISHLFKLIWNRKRSNMIMIIEIFFSFLVLFGVFTLVYFNLKNYLKPYGFEYENIWVAEINYTNMEQEERKALRNSFYDQLKNYPEIESYAITLGNLPFSFKEWNEDLIVDNQNIEVSYYAGDDQFAKTFNLKFTEGRWFDKTEDAANITPIVVNKLLAEKVAPNESALGKIIKGGRGSTEEFRVVGVIENFKKGMIASEKESFFKRMNPYIENQLLYNSDFVMKVKPGSGAALEEKILKDLGSKLGIATISFDTMLNMKKQHFKVSLLPSIILFVIISFLIFNVALGLFGVLYQNINKRYSEIGLRRAIGATKKMIHFQFIGEVLVLSTFGIILGCAIAFQFPLLNFLNIESGLYILAIASAVVCIFLLAFICSFYPGKQASKIQPAEALHYD
jgi:putative ABC transport system permease protein